MRLATFATTWRPTPQSRSWSSRIDFLLDGAANPAGQTFAGSVSDLVSKGVDFRVCNNTLVARNISPDKLLMEAKVVPAGVAEVAKLQAKEGFVYLRP